MIVNDYDDILYPWVPLGEIVVPRIGRLYERVLLYRRALTLQRGDALVAMTQEQYVLWIDSNFPGYERCEVHGAYLLRPNV